jgi:hypothetical protein
MSLFRISKELEPAGLIAAEARAITQYYKQEIEPHAGDLEVRRQQAGRRGLIFRGLFSAVAIVGVIGLLFMPGAVPVVAVVFGLTGQYLVWHLLTHAVRTDIKAFLMPRLCDYYGLNYTRNPAETGLNWFRQLELVPPYGRARIEDAITGSHDGVSFSVAEAVLERFTHFSKGNSYRRVFRGLIGAFSFHQDFEGQTLVASKTHGMARWHKIDDLGSYRFETGDTAFDETFDVFATNRLEALAILRAPFRERLRALAENVRSQKFRVAFDANRLLIAAPARRNLFEGGSIFKPIDHPSRLWRTHADIKMIFNLIESLDLEAS